MDQGGAFDRPRRRRRRRCVRRFRRCSRRSSRRETKADVIKPLDMNDAWTILVGVQFISSKTISKSHYMGFHNHSPRTYRNKQKRRSLLAGILELFLLQFPLNMWITVRCYLLLVIVVSIKGYTACFRESQASAHVGENRFERLEWPTNLELNSVSLV